MRLTFIFILSVFGFCIAQATFATSLNPFVGDDAPVCETLKQYPEPQRAPHQRMQLCHIPLSESKEIEFVDNRLAKTDFIVETHSPSSQSVGVALSPGVTDVFYPINSNVAKISYTPCTFGAVVIYTLKAANDDGELFQYQLRDLRPILMMREGGEAEQDAFFLPAPPELLGSVKLTPDALISQCEYLGGY